jgi:peptidoglycan/LPS O-acetylase OafA/YrhL
MNFMTDVFLIFVLGTLVLFVYKFKTVFFPLPANQADVLVLKREPFFDYLKGLAVISVIIIHVFYFYLYKFGHVRIDLFTIINNVLRFTIAIFFICSGILLNPKVDNWLKFYQDKLVRIFIPYALAVLVIALFYHQSSATFLYNLFSGQAAVPYYFIIVLLQFYLLYPALIIFRKKRWSIYAAFIITLVYYLIFGSLVVFGAYLFLEFLFFFFYGIYYRNDFLQYQRARHKKELWFWGLIITLYLIYSLVYPIKLYNNRYFYGIAIFNLLFYFRNYLMSNSLVNKILTSFGRLSLWIFLLHFAVVYGCYYLINLASVNDYFNFFSVSILAIIISYLVAFMSFKLYNIAIIGLVKSMPKFFKL